MPSPGGDGGGMHIEVKNLKDGKSFGLDAEARFNLSVFIPL